MIDPKNVLSSKEYRNYRNVRVAALMFLVLGGLFVVVGLCYVLGMRSPSDEPVHPVASLAGVAFGLTGVVGGVATRRGNRQWSPLVYVMAAIYVFAVPIGTILSYVLFTGMSPYLTSMERIRAAERRKGKQKMRSRDSDDS